MTGADGNLSVVQLNQCTSYMTPLNSAGKGHSNLTFEAGANDYVYNSIFYGGTVSVASSRVLGSGNFQFKTSGNTVSLSSSQVDPLFASPYLPNEVFPNQGTSWQDLQFIDYNLKANSPAKGKGSKPPASFNSTIQVRTKVDSMLTAGNLSLSSDSISYSQRWSR